MPDPTPAPDPVADAIARIAKVSNPDNYPSLNDMSDVKKGDGGEYRGTILEFVELRGVRTPCPKCNGLGTRVYGSTSTWRGGIGGQAMTTDVCDKCWGSGDKDRPWPSWRNK